MIEKHDALPNPCGFKSSGGLGRVWKACSYSWHGLVEAYLREAAFRQELAIGLPLIAMSWWLAPDRPTALAMSLSIVLVFVVELINSAIEALADTITTENHPLIKRAKDMGSAAVLLSILGAAATWTTVLSEWV
ncbi:MAG: diacylglycerol kinase [Pseudomonadota bacterium]